MRPFEILLASADALALLRLAVPRLHALRRSGYVAPGALLLAITQVLVEGARWQLLPAYLLAAVLFALWLRELAGPGHRRSRPLLRGLGVGAGVLLLLVSVALSLALPVFRLPEPTGPYAIGTLTYHWVDPSRPELLTADPGDRRELMAQVWYPAEGKPSGPGAPYIEDADAVTTALARLRGFPTFALSHFRYVTTNAHPAVPIATDKPSFPVLVYLTGIGGFRSTSTFQIEELVSHGYIVVGLDEPGVSVVTRFPDGRERPLDFEVTDPLTDQSVEPQPVAPTLNGVALPDGIIPYFGEDIGFTLDKLAEINAADPHGILTGRVDATRAGVFGMSYGGMTAAEACSRDSRLKAALIMDVNITARVLEAGLPQPVMLMTRDAATMRLERERSGGWAEKDIALTRDTMRQLYEQAPGAAYYIEIPGMFHVDFLDTPLWLPFGKQLGLTGLIDAQRGFDIVNAYSVAFFDNAIQGQPSPLLAGPSPLYPEAHVDATQH